MWLFEAVVIRLPANSEILWYMPDVKNAVKRKKEPCEAWLVQWIPEATDGYRQAKYAAARLSRIKNSGVEEFLVVHGGGLSVDVLEGRSSAPPTLYSESGKLLTSTGNLLNPTDTASVEDAEAKDSEFELIYHSG